MAIWDLRGYEQYFNYRFGCRLHDSFGLFLQRKFKKKKVRKDLRYGKSDGNFSFFGGFDDFRSWFVFIRREIEVFLGYGDVC